MPVTTRRRAQNPQATPTDEHLPRDVWEHVMGLMGNHIAGLIHQQRMHSVCTMMRGIDILLPTSGEMACDLNVATLSALAHRGMRADSVPVFDTVSRSVVRIVEDARFVSFLNGKLHDKIVPQSARLYAPAKMVYWLPRKENKQISNLRVGMLVDHDTDLDRVVAMMHKTIDQFNIDGETLQQMLEVQVVCRRGKRGGEEPTAAALDLIGKALQSERNRHIRDLTLRNITPLQLDLDTLTYLNMDILNAIASMRRLTLARTPTTVVDEVLKRASNLEMLCLSDINISSLHVVSITLLLAKWANLDRDCPNRVRGIAIDNTNLSSDNIWVITAGLCFCAIANNDDSVPMTDMFEEIDGGILTTGKCAYWFTHNTRDAPSKEMYRHLRDLQQRISKDEIYKFIHSWMDQFGDTPPEEQPEEEQPEEEQPEEEEPLPVADMASITGYSDAKRELDRHMWQWYSHTCRSCGTVWMEDAVTISWRQSVVSTCLHGKRKCTDRPEYKRMMNGERYLTPAHELTPPAQMAMDEKKKGRIVGIDPTTSTYVLFTPNGTKKVPV